MPEQTGFTGGRRVSLGATVWSPPTTTPEHPDTSPATKDQAAAGVLPHRRFGKHYRFSRDDLQEIVRRAGHTAASTTRTASRSPFRHSRPVNARNC